MQEGTIREHLHEVINSSDDRLLNILMAVADSYNDTADDVAEVHELERRRQRRLSGESKVYDWEEAKRFITAK